jgi:hypothetical protein
VKAKNSLCVALVVGMAVVLCPGITLGQKSKPYIQIVDSAVSAVHVASSSQIINVGQPVVIQANVDPTRQGGTTGTVTLTAIGSTAANTVASAPIPLTASGVVVWAPPLLNTDTYSVVAKYSGDSNFHPSESPVFTQYVADFAVGLPKTITIVKGAAVSQSLSLTSLNHFSGAVQLVCSGLPYKSSCNLTQNSLVLQAATTGAADPVTTAMTIKTAGETVTVVGSFLFFFGLGGLRRKRRLFFPLVVLGFLAFVVGLAGCAGGNRYMQNDGTPVGSYPITLVATSGGISHTSSITLNVVAK